MAKPKKQPKGKADKPVSQHEPTPEELDQAVKIEDLDAASLLRGMLKRNKDQA